MEKTIEWIKTSDITGFSRMIDQIVIPYEYKKVDIKTTQEMYNAIKKSNGFNKMLLILSLLEKRV